MPTKINPRDVSLSLVASRSTLELGEPWEILLHLVNHADSPLWLTDASTTLTLPAEVLHPSEFNVASRSAQFPTIPGPGIDAVCVQAGATYQCTWRVNGDTKGLNEKSKKLERLRWHVFFHPGKYDIQANIHLWTEPPDVAKISAPKFGNSGIGVRESPQDQTSGSVSSTEHITFAKLLETKAEQSTEMAKSFTLVAKGTIEVGIKATSAFNAAALGGLLAFAFRELYWAHTEPSKLAWKDALLLPTYVLTAVLLSLVVSRVTEARLPLTIRVMDFWGATAFGVLAAFLGNAIITKIIGIMP